MKVRKEARKQASKKFFHFCSFFLYAFFSFFFPCQQLFLFIFITHHPQPFPDLPDSCRSWTDMSTQLSLFWNNSSMVACDSCSVKNLVIWNCLREWTYLQSCLGTVQDVILALSSPVPISVLSANSGPLVWCCSPECWWVSRLLLQPAYP